MEIPTDERDTLALLWVLLNKSPRLGINHVLGVMKAIENKIGKDYCLTVWRQHMEVDD